MSGSLFYSEVAKYTPCLLCWWQRIFMYPQTLLIAMGIMKNDKNAADYSIGLSAVGAIISTYHYYIQLGGKSFFSCAQVGFSSECSERFSLEFGYVSIPMMALSAFVAIMILMIISKKKS
jgi:disulfide bond formation protein DsbB